ncbi:MAG: hypothetical protein HND46_08285 [Chloroflexi bacterium]|nr:hypothetical protein [Chloroflexota bacterium]NOG63405.1 hypothetical protein [Chloroflexota bacterium]
MWLNDKPERLDILVLSKLADYFNC